MFSPLHAQNEPLRVGVTNFTPPFVFRSGNDQFFGFDISMISDICNKMQRTCTFEPMRFNKLIPSLIDNQLDLAVNSITITPERSKQVFFSLPYLLSYTRFLTNTARKQKAPFSLKMLDRKRFGVIQNTVFKQQLIDMGIKQPVIIELAGTDELLNALQNRNVDYILLDNASAVYWEANSAGAFISVGEPVMYGYGFGIAINPREPDLVKSINQALLIYQNSQQYKENYQKYIGF